MFEKLLNLTKQLLPVLMNGTERVGKWVDRLIFLLWINNLSFTQLVKTSILVKCPFLFHITQRNRIYTLIIIDMFIKESMKG